MLSSILIVIIYRNKSWGFGVLGFWGFGVKHSCPDNANMTRELSKANEGANFAAYKKLLCVIKYVIDTKNLGLKIKPMEVSNEPWKIVCFNDSDYAGDPVSR